MGSTSSACSLKVYNQGFPWPHKHDQEPQSNRFYHRRDRKFESIFQNQSSPNFAASWAKFIIALSCWGVHQIVKSVPFMVTVSEDWEIPDHESEKDRSTFLLSTRTALVSYRKVVRKSHTNQARESEHRIHHRQYSH